MLAAGWLQGTDLVRFQSDALASVGRALATLVGRLQPTQSSSSPQELAAAEEEAAKKGAEGLVEISRKSFRTVCMDEVCCDARLPPRLNARRSPSIPSGPRGLEQAPVPPRALSFLLTGIIRGIPATLVCPATSVCPGLGRNLRGLYLRLQAALPCLATSVRCGGIN